ncbi:MAG: outer membrane protein assembly factor BamE [Bdellovibrionales bacterium]
MITTHHFRKYFARIAATSVAFMVCACASPAHQNLEKLQTGMDKTQVLDLAGNPKRTVRQNDGDLWTFVYYIGDRHYEKDVRFTNGHVAAISPAREVSAEATHGDAILKDYETLVNDAEVERKKGKTSQTPASP